MSSEADHLAARAKAFAIRVVTFVERLPYNARTNGLLKQLVDSASAESANYHAACRAVTRKDHVVKIELVAEQADESEHWLDVLLTGGFVRDGPARIELAGLYKEARELRAIFVASSRTARANYTRACASASARGPGGTRSNNP